MVGICACYSTKNYGSMLQTFATLQEIEKMGFQYELIRYTRKPTLDFIIRSLSRIGPYIVNRYKHSIQRREIEKRPDLAADIKRRNQCFESFMDSRFKYFSPQYDTFKELYEGAKKYQAVLVGSDQLWRPEGYSTGFYNLLFVPENIKKIAYATSFGVSQIPDRKKSIARKFLNRIEFISTRELRGSEIVKELTGRVVPTVVDPTLLFSGKEWEKYIDNKRVVEGNYIFCYLLGNNPDQREKVEEFSRKTGLQIVTIPHLDEFVECDVKFGDQHLFDVGPAEFVNLIRHASYVCTDSFHGTVFSIIHHKQFVTFNRFTEGSKNSRNSRIESLLKQTGLEERKFFTGENRTLYEVINEHINYDAVEDRLKNMRNASLSYLSDALNA